jgi:hypothetical protein
MELLLFVVGRGQFFLLAGHAWCLYPRCGPSREGFGFLTLR